MVLFPSFGRGLNLEDPGFIRMCACLSAESVGMSLGTTPNEFSLSRSSGGESLYDEFEV